MLGSGNTSPASRTPAIESASPAAVLFDFDFTLADSSKGCIDCIEYALQRLSLPLQPRERMRETIGLSLPAGLAHLCGIVDGEVAAAYTRHKPDPAALLLALERLGQEAEDVVYVGDHLVDAEAAAAAGIPFVAVLTGTTPVAGFAAHAPVAILESLAALPRVAGCQA